MNVWQLEVKKSVPQPDKVEVPAAQDGDSDTKHYMNIHGSLADVAAKMLMDKFGHEQESKVSTESWNLTAGDLTMQTTDVDDENNPDLWVYVVDGKTVANADLVMALEWYRKSEGKGKQLMVIESHGVATDMGERFVALAASLNVECRVSLRSAVDKVSAHYQGQA